MEPARVAYVTSVEMPSCQSRDVTMTSGGPFSLWSCARKGIPNPASILSALWRLTEAASAWDNCVTPQEY